MSIEDLVQLTGTLKVQGSVDSIKIVASPSQVSYTIVLPRSTAESITLNNMKAVVSADSITNGLMPVTILNEPNGLITFQIDPTEVQVVLDSIPEN